VAGPGGTGVEQHSGTCIVRFFAHICASDVAQTQEKKEEKMTHSYFTMQKHRIAAYAEIFVLDPFLVQVGRFTMRSLVVLGAISVVLTVTSLVFYVIIWALSMLINVIHSFVNVCHVLFDAAMGNGPVVIMFSFIFLLLINIKIACILFPTLTSIFKKEVRNE
jgi:hypothetical protein